MSRTIDTEEELYALWLRHGVVGASFRCVGGERIVVLSPGRRNDSAGPDFLGAVLLVDGELRVGAVEMHLREKEWFAHGHQGDPAYDAVILHLLAEVDGSDRALRLRLPTVGADALGSAESGLEPEEEEARGLVLSAELFAELSWERLLRRATEIVRSEADREIDDRLRRALLRRTFDALGYSRNREPMRLLAERFVDDPGASGAATFDELAALLFAWSSLDRESLARIGRGFMSADRLAAVLSGDGEPLSGLRWDGRTRPANSPETRLWAATKLAFDLRCGDLLAELFDALAEFRGAWEPLVRLFSVRMGRLSLVGRGRALEIAVNAALPVALAGGILTGRSALIEGSCRAYRLAPTLGSNRLLREIERTYLDGRTLRGAFWQQGAIEFQGRYRSPDRSGRSFVAERGPTSEPFRRPPSRVSVRR